MAQRLNEHEDKTTLEQRLNAQGQSEAEREEYINLARLQTQRADGVPPAWEEDIPRRARAHRRVRIKAPWFKTKLAEIFLETYPFDGYFPDKNADLITAYHRANEEIQNIQTFKPRELTLGLALATFFGLPTRLDPEKRLTFKQFLKNLIGGWTSLETDVSGNKLWTEKHRWQILAIPFKFLIIAPLKILTLPIKLLINLVKLFTEFVPRVLRTMSHTLLRGMLRSLARVRIPEYRLPIALIFSIIAIPTVAVFLASTAIHIIGRAMTSPSKSMMMGFYFGAKLYELKVPFAVPLGFTVGLILAISSFILSAFLWAIAFPLMMSTAVAYLPVLLQAATWVSQLPVISNLIAGYNAYLLWVNTSTPFLANTVVPLVTSLANAIGLQLSASLLYWGTAFAYTGMMFGTALSQCADVFSNLWAKLGWGKSYPSRGPLTWFISKLFPNSHQRNLERRDEVIELLQQNLVGATLHRASDGRLIIIRNSDVVNPPPLPSVEVVGLVQRSAQLQRETDRALTPLDAIAHQAEVQLAPNSDRQGAIGIGPPEYQQPFTLDGQTSSYAFPNYQGTEPVAYVPFKGTGNGS